MQEKLIESEKMLERKLKHEIESTLKGLCIKMEANYFSGVPDRLCLLPNRYMFFVEVKTTGKKPTKQQLYVHKLLKLLGFTTYIIDTSGKIDALIRTYEQR